MNYNSFTFWAFFGLIYAVYWKLNHRRQNTLLLVASYLFYGCWDYRFLFLILISTIIDYIGGLGVAGVELPRAKLRNLGLLLIGAAFVLCSGIHYPWLWQGLLHGDLPQAFHALPSHVRDFYVTLGTILATTIYAVALPHLYAMPLEKRRRWFLAISMIANLAILGYFKYCNFFVHSFAELGARIGLGHWDLGPLGIILPAGISFYTFQAMSYTIDIFRNELKPTENFFDFALFVCFFPHLVAGPIMRAHTLLPQVVAERRRKPGDVEEGLLLIVIGLFKKIVIADNMASIANFIFYRFSDHTARSVTGPETLIGLYAFAFQIYGDFSGYSSIARGISKLLGFELIVNFRMPYLAVSPSDFWRRWHISLSSWLRDYLYIPLGGNRGGTRLLYRNLFLTMLLGGLWHGASWTFVAWGFYHGLILCLFRLLNIQDVEPGSTLPERLRWFGRVIVMFHLTCFGWLLFRADSLSTALVMTERISTNFHFTKDALTALALIIFYCGVMFALEWTLDGEFRLRRFVTAPWAAQAVTYAYLIVMLFLFTGDRTYEFIYFQF